MRAIQFFARDVRKRKFVWPATLAMHAFLKRDRSPHRSPRARNFSLAAHSAARIATRLGHLTWFGSSLNNAPRSGR